MVKLKAPKQYFKPKPSPTTASIVLSALSMLVVFTWPILANVSKNKRRNAMKML